MKKGMTYGITVISFFCGILTGFIILNIFEDKPQKYLAPKDRSVCQIALDLEYAKTDSLRIELEKLKGFHLD